MIIGGGWDYRGGWFDNGLLNSVETINTHQLPDLHHNMEATTLTAVGTVIYHCGGARSPHGRRLMSDCRKLNIEDRNPKWQSTTSLPKAMYGHTAVAVSSHIWFAYESHLYDLDTQGSYFKSYRLPFQFKNFHCAVSNSSHSFIIGVGAYNDEVWINRYHNDPSVWDRFATIGTGRRYLACLLHGDNIYVSGGYKWSRSLARVEVINTKTRNVKRIKSMNNVRRSHTMMVLDDKPAAVGGYGIEGNLASIEVYDSKTDKWHYSSRSLHRQRKRHALAQLMI